MTMGGIRGLMPAGWAAAFFITQVGGFCTEPTNAPAASGPRRVVPIDLPTVLRLTSARNLDIQIARARLAEAEAGQEAALYRFFPWLSPGAAYGRHEGNLQQSSGVILDVSKEFYAPGVALTSQVQLGEGALVAVAEIK